jgi:hyperosmotically inducible protein
MHKKILLLSMLVFSFSIVLSESAAAQNNSRGDAFSRGRMERQIRKEILTLPYYNVFDAIGYNINGDTVTLTGYVVRPTTKKDAEESISDIDGVKRVVNNIEVLPLSPADDRLRYRILQTFINRGGDLYRYFMGSNGSIRIIVKNSRIMLEGTADNKGDANRAYILARGVSGGFSVSNNLKVMSDDAR